MSAEKFSIINVQFSLPKHPYYKQSSDRLRLTNLYFLVNPEKSLNFRDFALTSHLFKTKFCSSGIGIPVGNKYL